MKKTLNILLLILLVAGFASCETDNDSNPTFSEASSFILNTPPYAANNVYDLSVANSIELTCTQPAYGFPAATIYTVQVSLDKDFIDENGDTKSNYSVLPTVYMSADMNVSASELNAAIIELWSLKSEDDFPTDPINVYIRVNAKIDNGVDAVTIGSSQSNVIELPNVLGNTHVDKLEAPTKMFIIGSMLGWDTWKGMVNVTGLPGQFWTLIYCENNSIFKFGTKENEYIGYNDSRLTIDDQAEANIDGVDDGFGGENIHIGKAGWYVIYIKAKVKGKAYEFTMSFYPGNVYLFGKTNGGKWAYGTDNMFTVPDSKDGSFISPKLSGTGEVRMCVNAGTDWWRTEFTLNNGNIYYRENDNIVDGWNENKGSDYSIAGSPGKVIYLNFTTGIGEMK